MIRDDGWNYFMTGTKLLDVSNYIIYWVYFGLRIGITDYQLPLDNSTYSLLRDPHQSPMAGSDGSLHEHNVHSYMVFLNVIVLLTSFFKV